METLRESGDERATILKAHNDLRASLKLPLLRLNPDLNMGAQLWAEELLNKKKYEHSNAAGLGENIAQLNSKVPKDGDLLHLFNLWAAEGNNFENGVYPEIKKKKKEKVGHYSQMVWRNTTHIGVGFGRKGDRTVLVVRYFPAGNIEGYVCY